MANKCSFPNCDKPIFVKKTSIGSLCNGHYKQYKKLIREGKPLSEMKPLRQYKPREIGKDTKICRVDGCGRPVWGKYDYCQSHQRQIWKGIKPENLQPIRDYQFQINQICSIEGCDEPAKAKGLCAKHYSKYRNEQKMKKGKEDGRRKEKQS